MNPMNMGFNANNGTLGNMPMPNHGPNGVGGRMPDDHEDTNNEAKLNAYIYSYFCGKGKWDLARALKDSGLDFEPRLLNDNANGANDNMQTDSKDGIDLKRPDDLPVPDVGLVDAQGGSFLSSWFALFWDIYAAQRKSTRASANATQYVTQTQVRDSYSLTLKQRLIHLTATSSDAHRPAGPNAAGHARHGSWPARELSADDAISNCQWNAAEGFREQPRSISTVSLPGEVSPMIVVIVFCSSTRSLAASNNGLQDSASSGSNAPPGNDARTAQGSLRHGYEWTETTHTVCWGACTFAKQETAYGRRPV